MQKNQEIFEVIKSVDNTRGKRYKWVLVAIVGIFIVVILVSKIYTSQNAYNGVSLYVGEDIPDYKSMVYSSILPEVKSQISYEDFGVICSKEILKLGHVIKLSDYKIRAVKEFDKYKSYVVTDLANNLTILVVQPKGSDECFIHRILTDSKYIKTTRGLRIGNRESSFLYIYGSISRSGNIYAVALDNREMDVTINSGYVTKFDIAYE